MHKLLILSDLHNKTNHFVTIILHNKLQHLNKYVKEKTNYRNNLDSKI